MSLVIDRSSVQVVGLPTDPIPEIDDDRPRSRSLATALHKGALRSRLAPPSYTTTRDVTREAGTARLEEAVAAYRDALKEPTRERVPLQWATTQNNLGNALSRLGERESGTARLEEALALAGPCWPISNVRLSITVPRWRKNTGMASFR